MQGPEGRLPNVSPARKGWEIDREEDPSAVGAALNPSCALLGAQPRGSAVPQTFLGNVFRQSAARIGGNRTGAPRSPKRTWDENDGRSPTIALAESIREPKSDRLGMRMGVPLQSAAAMKHTQKGRLKQSKTRKNESSSFPSRPPASPGLLGSNAHTRFPIAHAWPPSQRTSTVNKVSK